MFRLVIVHSLMEIHSTTDRPTGRWGASTLAFANSKCLFLAIHIERHTPEIEHTLLVCLRMCGQCASVHTANTQQQQRRRRWKKKQQRATKTNVPSKTHFSESSTLGLFADDHTHAATTTKTRTSEQAQQAACRNRRVYDLEFLYFLCVAPVIHMYNFPSNFHSIRWAKRTEHVAPFLFNTQKNETFIGFRYHLRISHHQRYFGTVFITCTAHTHHFASFRLFFSFLLSRNAITIVQNRMSS